MRSNFFYIRILTVFALAVLLAGSLFAQGKGRGGGGGKGHGGDRGGGHQKQGGGDRGGGHDRQRPGGGDRGGNRGHEKRAGGNPWGGQRQEQRQMGGGNWQHQQRQVQHAQRQRQQVQHAQRQQAQQWQHTQRQQRQVHAQRQQAQQWQHAQRQQQSARPQALSQRQWQRSERHQQRAYQPRQNSGQFQRQQNFERKNYRNALKVQRHEQRDAWKYARKQQQFDDKAFRRATRHYRRDAPSYDYQRRDVWANIYQPRYRDYQGYEPRYRNYRTYAPIYQPYYQPEYRSYDYSPIYSQYPGYIYADDDSGYYGYQRSSWVEPLIRSVIASFFSNGIDGGYYDDYASAQPYYNSDYEYAPQYSFSEPTYHTFGYAPTHSYYEPAAYYGYDQYAHNSLPYDAFEGALPYNDVQNIYSGGLAGELIQRALGTGYYQGLLEGQQARKRGWGDRYYSDPYLYEQAIYDPYSSSIGDCRRYFSEGYEMGYDDALSGRDEYALAEGGDVDLVSLLLGNVLSLRG